MSPDKTFETKAVLYLLEIISKSSSKLSFSSPQDYPWSLASGRWDVVSLNDYQ
jgi:hypothetical protein